ncbi:MAG: FMN-binding protein [Bacteroidales bacterium]|nr:FMN-binding protein [Bacteroidales bacterium]
MKNYSNKYMLLYALGLSAVVAILLTVVSVSLKARQTRNQQAETKQMILKTIGIEASRENAEVLYSEHIKDTVTSKGLPYYKYSHGIILPMNGNGLWGPIWGYLALDSTMTVVGAVFDHQGETPGLGAEIATDKFANLFVGKKMDEHPIILIKNPEMSSDYVVDALSGATMTCNGVNDMLIKAYNQYSDLFFMCENSQDTTTLTMEEEEL